MNRHNIVMAMNVGTKSVQAKRVVLDQAAHLEETDQGLHYVPVNQKLI